MPRSNTDSSRFMRSVAQTMGCSPRSGASSFSDPPQSYDFDECLLDELQLRRHLAEVAAAGSDCVVSLKVAPGGAARQVSFDEVIAPLVENEAFGAQIQFTAGGHRFLDTFVSTRSGVRLVRLQLTS